MVDLCIEGVRVKVRDQETVAREVEEGKIFQERRPFYNGGLFLFMDQISKYFILTIYNF